MALTLDQRQPEVWIALAKINEGTGRREAALSALNKALELQPTSDEAHQLMGQMLQAMGRRDEAKEQYLEAIALRPDYWRHHSMLGAFYYSIGSYPRGDRRLYAGHRSSRRTTPGDFTTSGPSITALATPAMP